MSYETVDHPEYDNVPTDAELRDVSDQPAEGVHLCIDCETPVARTKGGRQFERCIDCRRAARNGGDTTTAAGSKRNTANWEKPLADQLTDMIDGLGTFVSFVEPFDGGVIRQGAPRLGQALIGPARTNKSVRKALENAVTGGAWAQVIMAAAAIALPIMQHHNMLPTQRKPKTVPFDQRKANEGHISV